MEATFLKIVSGTDTRLAARVLRPVLGAAAVPYGLAVRLRNRLYDSGVLTAHRVPVPVVSIGNLTLGGTGKTPFVEFVCRRLLDRGSRPVILSRGYRADGHGASAGNDEARVLAASLPDVPHLQGKDRVALARRAVAELQPDTLVLDDGFQHRRLARDLDIVLIDCTGPFGYGRLFPRGLLREPVSSLRRADLVVLSRADLCTPADRDRIRGQIVAVAGDKPIVLAEHRPTALRSAGAEVSPLGSLSGRTVAAFCGIGNPAAFWQTLTRLGCHLAGTRVFPDHHAYSAADLAALGSWAGQFQPEFVITTQKDLVKISVHELGGCPLLALQIEASVHDLDGHLDRALARISAARATVTRAA